jgi:hypothetical protein
MRSLRNNDLTFREFTYTHFLHKVEIRINGRACELLLGLSFSCSLLLGATHVTRSTFLSLVFLFSAILRIELRASCLLGKHFTI